MTGVIYFIIAMTVVVMTATIVLVAKNPDVFFPKKNRTVAH
jgi:hypothetical protein